MVTPLFLTRIAKFNYLLQRLSVRLEKMLIVFFVLDNYFRKDESKYSGNPAIPSQPISYSTAYEILQ